MKYINMIVVASACLLPSFLNAQSCEEVLSCGQYNGMVRAGIAPTIWRKREAVEFFSPFAMQLTNNLTIPLFDVPSFEKLFHFPWIVGGQIGYMLADNIEVYGEANYRQASKRTLTKDNVIIPNDVINVVFDLVDNYRAVDAYVGARVYFDTKCERWTYFIGAKVGFVHHNTINFNYSFTPQMSPPQLALSSMEAVPLFLKNNIVAGGANGGFMWCWGCGWSAMLIGEVVANCGVRSNRLIALENTCTQLPSIVPCQLLIGEVDSELFFPVTFGIKYSF